MAICVSHLDNMLRNRIVITKTKDAAHASSFWASYGSKAKLYISTDNDAIGFNNADGSYTTTTTAAGRTTTVTYYPDGRTTMMVTQTAEQNMGTNIGGGSGVAVVATPETFNDPKVPTDVILV